MYGIRWYDGFRQCVLVGNVESIFALANLLENKKTDFKVSSVSSGILSQKMMGVGGFAHWKEE